jgi:hypothetical protein
MILPYLRVHRASPYLSGLLGVIMFHRMMTEDDTPDENSDEKNQEESRYAEGFNLTGFHDFHGSHVF